MLRGFQTSFLSLAVCHTELTVFLHISSPFPRDFDNILANEMFKMEFAPEKPSCIFRGISFIQPSKHFGSIITSHLDIILQNGEIQLLYRRSVVKIRQLLPAISLS